MLKKILIPAICLLILSLSIVGYIILRKESVSAKTDIYISVPGEPCAILQINNLRSFQESLLYNNNYWLNLTAIKTINNTHTLLATLDSLKDVDENIAKLIDRGSLIAIYPQKNGKVEYLITSQISASEYETAKNIVAQNFIPEIRKEYYSEFLIASPSDSLIEAAKSCIDKKNSPILEDEYFHKARLSSGGKQEANIFINAERCQALLHNYIIEERERLFDLSKQYDSWCGYDVDFSEDKIEINGFAYYKNPEGVAAAFKNQNTEHNTLASAMPYNTFFFRHFSISDLEAYRQLLFKNSTSNYDLTEEDFLYDEINYSLSDDTLTTIETSYGESPETFFQEFFGGEIALGYSPIDVFVVVKLANSDEALAVLRRIALEINPNSSIRNNGFEIFHLGQTGFAGNVFGKYFTLYDEYLCISGGNLIIAPSEQFITYIASRNAKTQTLQCAPVFKSADRTLLSTSNRSIFIDIPYVVRNADKFFTKDFANTITKERQIWTNFDCIGLQSETEGNNQDFQHIFIQYSGTRGEFVAEIQKPEDEVVETTEQKKEEETKEVKTEETIEQNTITGNKIFSVKLDAPAAIKPQQFTNHYTAENEIFIQDTKNQIYLISASGKILWKTTIKERIVGGIESVDMLKNKKLQIAFLTENYMYIVDRKGNILSGYPREISGKVCTQLSVFDYNKDKEYRFAYGTKDNKVHIIKKDGTSPDEWKNVTTKSNIIGRVKHFTLSNKDYILFSDANKSYFLDRKANHRLTCGANLCRAINSDTYTDASGLKMVMSLDNGKISIIHTNDKAISTWLKQYPSNHYFSVCGKYYVFSSNKGVDFYDTNLNLAFSDNIDGGIIESYKATCCVQSKKNGKIYIYTTDKESFTKTTIDSKSNKFSIFPLKPSASKAIVVSSGELLEAYSAE